MIALVEDRTFRSISQGINSLGKELYRRGFPIEKLNWQQIRFCFQFFQPQIAFLTLHIYHWTPRHPNTYKIRLLWLESCALASCTRDQTALFHIKIRDLAGLLLNTSGKKPYPIKRLQARL